MADIYCNDGGSNTSPYDTWAKAATTLAVALAFVSAGDDIWVQSDHVEDTAASLTMSTAGTSASVIRIISVTNLNEPPTNGDYESMITGGGKISNISGSFDMTFGAGDNMWTGIFFEIGDDLIFELPGVNRFDDCKFSVSDLSRFGDSQSGGAFPVYWNNVDFDQVTAGNMVFNGGQLEWRGGTLIKTGSFATSLFEVQENQASKIVIEDVDLSILEVGNFVAEIENADQTRIEINVNRCKTPVFTTGGLLTGSITHDNTKIKFHSCWHTNIIHQFQENYLAGQINDDPDVYLNATYDGTNGYSAKLVTNSFAKEWSRPLKFKLADVYSAANPTITVEFTNDGTTYQNDELWLEIEYPDGTTGALGKLDTSSRATDVLTTPANLTASSESWTGTGGFGGEVKQKIAVTISGGQAGAHRIWVCLAKPSDNVYIDPKVLLS